MPTVGGQEKIRRISSMTKILGICVQDTVWLSHHYQCQPCKATQAFKVSQIPACGREDCLPSVSFSL